MRSRVLWLLMWAVFAVPLGAQASLRVAVLGMVLAGGQQATIVSQVTDIIIEELSRSEKYQVIERSAVDLVLDEKGIRSPSGEVQAKEVQQAGRYLDADLVVVARAYRFGHSLVLEAEMIDVATGEIIHLAHASSEQRGTLNVMLDEARLVGRRLAGREETEPFIAETEVTQPASDQVSESLEPRVLTSDAEPSESEEPEAHKDRSFLWGLTGFILTAVPGAIGLGISAQSAPDIEDAAGPLGSTAGAATIGAGVSLFAALLTFERVGFSYLKAAFYGDLVGLGVLFLAAIAVYPEILPYSLAVILLLVTEPIWRPLGCLAVTANSDEKAVFLGFSIPAQRD